MATSWLDAVANSGGAVLHYLAMNSTVVAAGIAGGVAVIVARTTLHGVKMSLASSEAKTTRELAHSLDQENRNREHTRSEAEKERSLDAAKARHERLTEMRRGVYLDAVAETIKFHGALGELPKFDFEKGGSRELIESLAVTINRIVVVAEQETAISAKKAHNVYMSLFMRCLVKAAAISQRRKRIYAIDQALLNVDARRDEYLESMRQFNLAQRTDQGAFQAIQAQLAINEQERAHLVSEQAELHTQNADDQNSYTDYLVTEVRQRVSDQLDKLLVAMRTELELSSDIQVFQSLSAETNMEVADLLAEMRAAMSTR